METAKTLAKENYNIILHYNSNKSKAFDLKTELEKLTDKRILIVQSNLLVENEIVEMLHLSFLGGYCFLSS